MKKCSFLKKTCMLLLALVLVGTSFDMSSMNVMAASKSVTLSATKKTIVTSGSFTLKVKGVKGLKSTKVKFKSSNTKIATVSSSKSVTSVKVNGKKVGTATITAVSTENSKVKATCKVTVKQGATSVKVTPNKKSIKVGDKLQLKAAVSPSKASKSVAWSTSDSKIATVDSKGVVKAKSTLNKGSKTVTITATAKDGSGKKGTCKVTVVPKLSVKMNATSLSVAKNGRVKLVATVSPSYAKDTSVSWKSSNKSIATVDKKGNVKALKNGTVTITATAKGDSKKKASCKITVKKMDTVSKLQLTATKGNINAGDTYDLSKKLSVTPSKLKNTKIYWASSNTSVATVDTKGKIKGVKAGTAKITGTTLDGSNKTVTYTVTVYAKTIKLNKTKTTLEVGKTRRLTATVSDAKGTKVTWSSDNKAVATIDSNGTITAVAAGTATVTAKSASGKTAKCVVTVPDVLATSVEVTGLPEGNKLAKGDTAQLTAVITPEYTTNKTVAWACDTEGVTVDANGLVTVTNNAETNKVVTITATVGKVQGTCQFTVTGSTDAVTVGDTSIDVNVDKNASAVKVTKDGKSVEKDQTYIEEKMNAAKDRAEAVITAESIDTLIEKACQNVKDNYSMLGANVNIAKDTDKATVTVDYKGTVKVIEVVKLSENSAQVTEGNRVVTVKNIVLGDKVTEGNKTSREVTFAVDVTVDGKANVTDKEFKANVAVDTTDCAEGLYAASLSTKDGQVIASCTETADAVTATVDKAAADQVLAELATGRDVAGIMANVTVENIYR